MAKVNDLPQLEKDIRNKQAKNKKASTKKNKKDPYTKLLNDKTEDLYTCESSHFQNVVDESKVFQPYPNFPAPVSIYPLFHTAKPDFNSTYRVLHNNRKFSIPEPDIYKIKRQIFEEERQLINNILKRNNNDIRGNVNVNIYNP